MIVDEVEEPCGANPEPSERSTPHEATSSKDEETTIPVAPEAEEASTEQLPPPSKNLFPRAEPEPADQGDIELV